MECIAKQAASARALQALYRPQKPCRYLSYNALYRKALVSQQTQHLIRLHNVRHASSKAPEPPPSPSKPIVLEQPDKFRPPSHAARRNARSTTGMYGAGAAYNQGMSERERQTSKTKKYPNMFPEEGTRMHWFLTTRWVHITISLFVLTTLAFTSLISTWSQTSPFAHLIPPSNMLLWSPFTYFSELISVFRLHSEYTTQQTAESRRQNILDAQKRRLYRRAHGMEDLTADEVSGPDIRGLVEWDDGLTNKERERGGQYRSEMIGARMQDMGQRAGEGFNELMERKRGEQVETETRREAEKEKKRLEEEKAEQERLVRIRGGKEEERPRRKVYFGIWG